MTRVHTQRHFSRLLLLFSSSGALHASHCLTLLLLGLTSLCTVLSCDEKTRSQSRDPSTLPCHAETRRYMEQRNLDASGMISEWPQRENKLSSMLGQSTSDVTSDHHPSDLLKIQFNRYMRKQTYDDDTFVSIIPNNQRGDQMHSEINYLKRKFDDQFDDFVKNQQVSNKIKLKNIKQSESKAKNWLDNLIRKQRRVSLQATSYFSTNEIVNKVQFQDQDSDNDASLTILDGPRQSADNLLESSVHDRDTLIEAPIDQLHLREASSVNHLAIPMRSRRDRNEVDLDEAKRANLNTDNLFAETPVNRMSERTSDFTVQRDSRENEILSRSSGIDVAANQRGDDTIIHRSDRKTVDFESTRQTHLDGRNIHALDNRTSRSESTVDYLLSDSDNFNIANESTNLYVGTIAINTVADNFDVSAVSIEDQVEVDGISEIENRTDINLDETEILTVDCRNSACSESNDNDNVPVFRTKKYGRAKESNDNQKDEGYFVQVGGVSTIPINDNDTDINVVDSEAPFTGFEGSQKFPVKINHKSPSELPQVEKFDRRHFGPQKEDILEETSTWYPSTVLLELPKSPSRNVLHRHRKTDDVVGMDEEDNRGEKAIEGNEKLNDTFDESWLPDMSSGVKSSSEKLAVTPNITYVDFENVTKKDKNDSDGRVEIDVTVPSARPIEKTNITILGLFELTYGTEPRPEGSCELEAAKLAVERVNESDVLKRFRLRLIYNDTKAVNDLVTELEQANITCTATITFAENDYKEQLRTLKELDTRIIIGSFSPKLARRVFCEAWKLGMHGGDYAWILPGDTVDSLMTSDRRYGVGECSPSQLSQTLDGLIIVRSHATVVGDEISDSGLTSAKFTSELVSRGADTSSKFAGQTYDAVWAMALALAKTEVLLNRQNESMAWYTHLKKDFIYLLLKQLKLLRFIGVSGSVSFDDADRVGITAFYQMQGHTIRRIAIYTPEDGKLIMNCPGCMATRWPGGQVPAARRVFRLRMVTVAPAAFLAVTCIASVGVTLALAFLAFNLHFRKHKSIKLSSPRLNNMAAVGCGLVYGAVILLGLDDATLPDSDGYYPTVCKARVYLLSAGFSLAFGSMFTKTYRVHRIFTRSRSGVVKNKLLQDTQLIFLICMLLVIDVVVVTLWVILDPMQRHLQNLTLEISPQDRGVVYQPQVEVCRSQHTNGWLSALYVYKGLLLVVGVYMAWETRHVKIPALNDSQYIGMSVYFVVITSSIVVVLANLMPDRATLAFVTITALILTSTTATLALLFLPQLANILAGERADPVVQSFGLKIECNTRRFVTDDRRELQYRVEVQNRVYRREMAQLELELARLEKQLAQEPTEPSRASSSTSIPQRNPSIGGGLPLLLLSVLPPVIPRASWPSADSSGIRRGTVAFSSQPDLEPDDPRQSLADLYKLHRRRETEGPNRLGVFQRLFSLFGSRPSSRKTSTASFTGVASALRVHMGYIAGLVPGTKAASTCQVDAQGTHSPHARCGSGPIISITSEEDRRLSLGLRRKESSEPRVNFSLPPQTSTSQSSSREKIRGSPRFPHRIVPANSLSAIAQGTSVSRPHRWHSMEDATKPKTAQTTSHGSCSPNFDVWATSEVGVPFSELANTVRGRKPPDSLTLTITVDSTASPVDTRLGNDLKKLFRENDGQESVNPAEYELKTTRSSSSSSSSLRIISGINDVSLKNDFTSEVQQDTVSNFCQETKSRPSSPVISVVDTGG
ncbi:hypothetical protein ACFW04_004488 [Cataglyphis niger]